VTVIAEGLATQGNSEGTPRCDSGLLMIRKELHVEDCQSVLARQLVVRHGVHLKQENEAASLSDALHLEEHGRGVYNPPLQRCFGGS